MKSSGITFARIKPRQLFFGLGLVVLSFFMPLFFNVHSFHVLSTLGRALLFNEKIILINAAIKLVALNSLRGIPHYVGAYFAGVSIEFKKENKIIWQINALMIWLILLATYWGIEMIYNIKYDFGIPAIILSSLVLFFGKTDYQYISPFKKGLQIIFFLVALQFLDIMPAINGLPVGRGEVSIDIKQASVVMAAETLLNVLGTAGSLIFFLFGVLVFYQLRVENKLRQLAILQKENQEIRMKSQLNEMSNRTHQEMQHMAHDLKSPLTSMQALVGMLKMKCEKEERKKDAEYLGRVEYGIDQMSQMISAILYEDQRTEVETQVILDAVLSQISIAPYAAFLHGQNEIPGVKVYVNRFLFPRVLVNLIENSANAVPPGRLPSIMLTIFRACRQDMNYICFSVADNGAGIPSEQESFIWNRNVSGTQSTGLGLAFVRNVVDKSEGDIEVNSTPGEGTIISILLPERSF